MRKLEIDFVFKHYKLLNYKGEYIKRARLLSVLHVKLEDIPNELLVYDTDEGSFILPTKGDYLLLIFLKPYEEQGGSNLFTTLRKDNKENNLKYNTNIGKIFFINFIPYII